jgi:aminopeptidase N
VEEINAAGKRIKEAVPSWNQFYDWISTFSNSYLIYRDQGKKLKMDNVYTRTQEILDAKMKVSAAEDAAKAATEADMAATQSCIEAEKASFQAKAIAQKLFLSKLAELEAFAVLEKDTAAKDVVRKKVSESTSRLLQDAVKAAKEAEGFAEAARKAADDSLNAKLHAEEAASSVSTTIQAREEAYDAAMTAKESMTKACAAAQRAHVAAESASVNVAEMTNNVESTDKNFLKEKILSLSRQPMKVGMYYK